MHSEEFSNTDIDSEHSGSWESLTNTEAEPMAALATHALRKKKAGERERIEQDRRQAGPKVPYNYRRKKTEQNQGHVGTSKLDVRDRTSDKQVIEQELQDYGADTVDELGAVRGLFSSKQAYKKTEQILNNYEGLFKFLGEDTKNNPNVVEEYQQISDKKERLRFILSSSLPDRVRLFCSESFNSSNCDSFARSLQRQQDLIDGTTMEWQEYWNVRKRRYIGANWPIDPSRVDQDYIMLNLNRASLESAMIGTPEFGAYKMAKSIQKDRGRAVPWGFPVIYGNKSGINDKSIGSWEEIIDEYSAIADQVARNNPGMDEESLEHKSVRRAAHLFVDSMRYIDSSGGPNSSHKSLLHEAVAWARLGREVQAPLLSINRKTDLHNLERFIGKSGYSKKRKSMEAERANLTSRLMYIYGLPDDDEQEFLNNANAFEVAEQKERRRKETERIEHKYDKLISKTRSEERRNALEGRRQAELQRINQDVSERSTYYENRTMQDLIADIKSRIELLSRRIEKNKSLAEKAIDLHLKLNVRRRVLDIDNDEYIYESNSKYHGTIDWINDAPFGVIKRAHRRINNGESADDVYLSAITEIITQPENEVRDKKIRLKGTFGNFAERTKEAHPELNPEELFKSTNKLLSAYEGLNLKEDVFYNLVQNGQINIDALNEYPWLKHQYSRNSYGGADHFPAEKSDSAKYKWCSDNSFVWLDGDWGRQTIGKIIFTRLQAGVEDSIHDATQWLSTFQIPETTYDVPRIKKQIERGAEGVDVDDFSMRLRDYDEESRYLARILSAPQSIRSRLKLSTKPQNMSKLFSNPEHILVYTELVKVLKNPEIDFAEFEAAVQDRVEDYYNNNMVGSTGKNSGWRMPFDEFQICLEIVLGDVTRILGNENEDTERIGEIAQRLNQYGQNRKAYIDDTTSWLVKHAVSPQQSLTKAWSNRAIAIANGANDNASEINNWADVNALIISEGTFLNKNGISGHDLNTTYAPFAKELTRCYGVRTAAEAIVNYKEIHNPEKILPAASIPLEVGGRRFTGEVLAHDDPRGMTIGFDTGCCMTVDGVSKSCIESGYRDSGAGFFAYYDDRGKINAQSFFFTHPEYPEVVVMDNIEANSGRDSDLIIDVYQQFFKEYLKDRFASDPNWTIRQVNVGTGYGDVAKAQVLRLEPTKIVQNNLSSYSDARVDQRVLVRLTDAEIAEARERGQIAKPEANVEPNHSPIPLASPLGINQLPILQSLESQLYPESMRQYDSDDFAYQELTMPGVDKYSFLIKLQEDATSEASGYCLAYEDSSMVDPNYQGKVVYVADFGILPNARGGMTALKAFNELLQRIEENGVDRVEMEAREKTSFRLLASDWGRRFLARKGFDLVVHDSTESFGDGEITRLVSLEKRRG